MSFNRLLKTTLMLFVCASVLTSTTSWAIDMEAFKASIADLSTITPDDMLPECRTNKLDKSVSDSWITKSCRAKKSDDALWRFTWEKKTLRLSSVTLIKGTYAPVMNVLKALKDPPIESAFFVWDSDSNVVQIELKNKKGSLNVFYNKDFIPLTVSDEIGKHYLSGGDFLPIVDLSVPDAAIVCGDEKDVSIRFEHEEGEFMVRVALVRGAGSDKTSIARIKLQDPNSKLVDVTAETIDGLDKIAKKKGAAFENKAVWVAKECLRLRLNIIEKDYPQHKIRERAEDVGRSLIELRQR